ncbi:MAG: alpha/beta hydrolase [Polyangiaceae bacterium]|nr:alpha/beta hydrolase [Polyangiaceae bacterium]MCE7893007.1 alpha/beta hydrolase [Sorangiineae bacterium PRO1]MCL4752917.1 alpha/beta hydrolase [Myxococcales bacterium]
MKPFTRGAFAELPETPRVAHAYAKSQPRTLELDSRAFGRHAVHLRELGEGPPLLLIHGLMTSSYSWRYVLEPLSRSFRVIAPDLPGAGRSAKPDVPYTAAAMARWIIELTDALGIRGCRTIGNSLGGYLCMRAVLEDPQVFTRLVNIHSPGTPDARLWALHAALAVPGVRAALARFVRRDPQRWVHRNVHYFDESLKSLEEAREYGAVVASPEGSRAFVRYLGETLDPRAMRDFVRAVGRGPFPIPLQLVYARQDPMVPPRVGDELAALLPGAELHWLEDTSHFAQVDSPERLLAVVEPFLSSPRT